MPALDASNHAAWYGWVLLSRAQREAAGLGKDEILKVFPENELLGRVVYRLNAGSPFQKAAQGRSAREGASRVKRPVQYCSNDPAV